MEEIENKVEELNITKEEKENIRVKFGIDRDLENKEIQEYINSGDESVFERVYQRRLPTIDYLAKKYKWLSEDSASEIRMVLVRTVNGYRKNGKTTDFNTYFFSSVKNHFSNIAKKKFRKKRTIFDGTDPLNKTISLDDCVGDDDSVLFHELISSDVNKVENDIDMDYFLNNLSEGNEFLFHVISEILNYARRQISKKDLVFKYNFPMVSGDALLDVSFGTGLPNNIFTIIDTKINNNKIEANISIKSKKLLNFLSKKIRNNNVFSYIEGKK